MRAARRGLWVLGAEGLLGAALLRVAAEAGLRAQGSAFPDGEASERRLARALDEARPEALVLAPVTRAGLGGHRRAPATLAAATLRGFLGALRAARAARVPRLLHLLSHCAYPADAPQPLREPDLWAGSPAPDLRAYGLAQRSAVALTDAAAREQGVAALSVVLPGLYGPGDLFDEDEGQVVGALVARFERARIEGAPSVSCWGRGRARRELLYAPDAARALLDLLALPRGAWGGVEDGLLNLGRRAGARETSVAELAAAVARAVGYEGRIAWDVLRPEGRPRVRLDDGRAARLLAARAGTPLAEGLSAAVADHRAGTASPSGARPRRASA